MPTSPGGIADRRERAVPVHVGDDDHAAAAVGAERELEQLVRNDAVRPCEVSNRRRLQALPLAQVHRDAVGSDEAGDVLDRGRQRVLQRELRRRLRHDREQRARPLELAHRLPRGVAGMKSLRRAQRERGQAGEDACRRDPARTRAEARPRPARPGARSRRAHPRSGPG